MKKLFLILAVSLVVCLAACATRGGTTAPVAVANLEGRSGSSAHGTVRFAESPEGMVTVYVDLVDIAPGVHGFHVHEKGDCSDAEGKSAGGHFAPLGNPHGGPDAAQHHAGDFGNVTADANGRVDTHFTTRAVTVSPGPTSVVGRAVVVHAKADDLVSQPSGNAGARIACGVINLKSMQ